MARIPTPPKIGDDKPFLRRLIEAPFRIAFGLWVTMQAIGLFFYIVWHISPHHFREFMFRDFIDYWDKWGDYILTDLLPAWVQHIPTWRDPIVWIFLGIVALIYLLRRTQVPSLSSIAPPASPSNPYQSNTGHSSSGAGSHAGGQAGAMGGQSSQAPPEDDDFEFDEERFKQKAKATKQALVPVKPKRSS